MLLYFHYKNGWRNHVSNVNVGKLGCRHCRHYQQQGHRGGNCLMLGVAVAGAWKACPLLVPPFAPSWEQPETGRARKSQMLERSSSPTVRQGFKPLPQSESPLKRTDDFFSPLQRTFAISQGINSLADYRKTP